MYVYGEKEQFIKTTEVCPLRSETLVENCNLSKWKDARQYVQTLMKISHIITLKVKKKDVVKFLPKTYVGIVNSV